MSFETVTFACEGGVGTLTLNRPQSLNSLNKTLIGDIRTVLRATRSDAAVRALLITGAGRGFCAGADLANAGFDDGVSRSVGEGVAHSMEIAYNPLVRDIADYPKPVVAAVNGVAAGGGVGLALACDIVFAARSAYFVQVFGPRLGLVPDMGCTWLLPRLVGRARARALALIGDRVPAEEAERIGLIWKCVDDAQLMPVAQETAQRLAKGPTRAFGKIKHLLDAAETLTLDQALEMERRTQGELGDLPDFREGVTAFLSKREPRFTGQ